MTRDDIIALAKEAGFMQHLGVICIPNIQNLERFAVLVAAPLQERIQLLYEQLGEAEKQLDAQYKMGTEAEREACAKVCVHNAELYASPNVGWESSMECAAAIRARGNNA